MRRIRNLGLCGLFLAGIVPFGAGCGESTEVPLQKAPEVTIPASTPPPTGEAKKFGGAGSSASSKMNPGASS